MAWSASSQMRFKPASIPSGPSDTAQVASKTYTPHVITVLQSICQQLTFLMVSYRGSTEGLMTYSFLTAVAAQYDRLLQMLYLNDFSRHTQLVQPWAARYNTGLLKELTPKGVVFSFLFFSTCAAATLHEFGSFARSVTYRHM